MKKRNLLEEEIDPEVLERMPHWFQRLYLAGKKRP
jgi:hypothetical protein